MFEKCITLNQKMKMTLQYKLNKDFPNLVDFIKTHVEFLFKKNLVCPTLKKLKG